MPIRLSKPALAALGLLKSLGPDADESDTATGEDGNPSIDDLVESGEEVYDALLARVKKRRDTIEADIKSRISGLLSDLGVATREEIRDLREHMASPPRGQDNFGPSDKES